MLRSFLLMHFPACTSTMPADGCLASSSVLNRHNFNDRGYKLVVLFYSSAVRRLLSSWNEFQKPKPARCPALDDATMKTFIGLTVVASTCSHQQLQLRRDINCCWIRFFVSEAPLICLSVIFILRDSIWFGSVFFSPRGRCGMSQGEGPQNNHTHTVSAIASRKDLNIIF